MADRPAFGSTISYTDVRSNLAKTIDRVCDDHTPVTITRKGRASAVLMALEDYHSLVETTYLLRSPKNATRLLESIEELRQGRGRVRKLAT